MECAGREWAGTRRLLGSKTISSRRWAFASWSAICKAVTAMPTRWCSSSADGKVQVWLVAGRQRLEIPVDAQGADGRQSSWPFRACPERDDRGPPSLPLSTLLLLPISSRAVRPPPRLRHFRDKIVIIGATAVGLSDQRITPFDPAFPGVETHATIIDNVLRQHFLVEPWWGSWFTTANILLVGLCLMLLLPRLGALRGDIVTALIAAGECGAELYALHHARMGVEHRLSLAGHGRGLARHDDLPLFV